MSDKQLKSNMSSVPIWKKMNLTVKKLRNIRALAHQR